MKVCSITPEKPFVCLLSTNGTLFTYLAKNFAPFLTAVNAVLNIWINYKIRKVSRFFHSHKAFIQIRPKWKIFLPLYLLKRVKSLSLHILEPWERYPFRPGEASPHRPSKGVPRGRLDFLRALFRFLLASWSGGKRTFLACSEHFGPTSFLVRGVTRVSVYSVINKRLLTYHQVSNQTLVEVMHSQAIVSDNIICFTSSLHARWTEGKKEVRLRVVSFFPCG